MSCSDLLFLKIKSLSEVMSVEATTVIVEMPSIIVLVSTFGTRHVVAAHL